MISIHKYKNISWLDLESPTRDELSNVGKEFGINSLTLHELEARSERPKVDIYNNYIYLILHFPKYSHGKSTGESFEIDFIIGKDFLITAHYDSYIPMVQFSKIFETNSILNKISIENGGHAFYYLTKKIYEGIEEEMGEMEDALKDIELFIFEERGIEPLEKLSRMNKELIDFRRTIKMHKEIFRSFEKASKEFFGEKFSYYTTSLLGSFERVWHAQESNREILLDLRQTIDSLYSARTNSVMRTLTILNFISIPLSLIATFGQNAQNIPIIGHDKDFYMVIGLMLITSAIMLVFFKLKKWL